jgi:hypothetical protein
MLKPYMVYSRLVGPEEGAALVFAHSARQARNIGYGPCSDFIDEYIDCESSWLKNRPWLFEEANKDKLAKDEPHVIVSPKCCSSCEHWGQSAIGEDGICEDCREEFDNA